MLVNHNVISQLITSMIPVMMMTRDGILEKVMFIAIIAFSNWLITFIWPHIQTYVYGKLTKETYFHTFKMQRLVTLSNGVVNVCTDEGMEKYSMYFTYLVEEYPQLFKNVRFSGSFESNKSKWVCFDKLFLKKYNVNIYAYDEKQSFQSTEVYNVYYTITSIDVKNLTKFSEIVSKYYEDQKNVQMVRYNKYSVDINSHILVLRNWTNPTTFDCLFFPKKQELIGRLDKFLNKDEKLYKTRGMQHTFNLCLYGPPGTGKTSVIKAIVNYTGKTVFIANPNFITTTDEFNSIMERNNEIIVIEEIDCGAWKNIIKKRSANPIDSDNQNEINNLQTKLDKISLSLDASNETDKRPKIKQTLLTLSDILTSLDGLIEIPGRIVIITSNYLESLDPALYRIGRMDMVIEFRKMMCDDIAQMFKKWFDTDLPPEVREKMIDGVFTQAEIVDLFRNDDLSLIYKVLSMAQQ